MFVKGETSERDGRDVSSPLRRRDGGEREGFRSLSKRASQPEREAAPQRVAALSRVSFLASVCPLFSVPLPLHSCSHNTMDAHDGDIPCSQVGGQQLQSVAAVVAAAAGEAQASACLLYTSPSPRDG